LANTEMSCTFLLSSRRRHTRSKRDWSSDVCSSDLAKNIAIIGENGSGKTSLFETIYQRGPSIDCSPKSEMAYYQQLSYQDMYDEIGRASCRGRQCRSVAVSGQYRR